MLKKILESEVLKHIGSILGFIVICALSASVGNLIIGYMLV